ncbi:MAG: polyphosphate polymerase domain-containing protein [Ignavibacteriaceae bacterium]
MKPMRLEYKYLLSNSQLNEFRSSLLPFVEPDEYAANRELNEYTVRSIYFDSMNLDDYRDKIEGIKIRKKLRVRGYNEDKSDSTIFLEIKRKFENHISKNRAPLKYSNLDELLRSSDIENLIMRKKGYLHSEEDAKRFFYHYKQKTFVPVVLVVYEREAYFSKHDLTLRITIDKNLRSLKLPGTSDLFNDNELKRAMLNNVILELKFFNGFPQWLQKMLTRFELQRRPLSKYTICVDNHMELKNFIVKKRLLLPDILPENVFTQKVKILKYA